MNVDTNIRGRESLGVTQSLTNDEVGRGEEEQRRGEEEGEVGRGGDHVGPRGPVAALSGVHLARGRAAHPVEQTKDVEQ